jgi:hypothetical protein
MDSGGACSAGSAGPRVRGRAFTAGLAALAVAAEMGREPYLTGPRREVGFDRVLAPEFGHTA